MAVQHCTDDVGHPPPRSTETKATTKTKKKDRPERGSAVPAGGGGSGWKNEDGGIAPDPGRPAGLTRGSGLCEPLVRTVANRAA